MTTNADPSEIAKFERLAARWWDPAGEARPLHEINPLRLGYVEQRAGLADKTVVDVGCGGGILSEAMAARGARVTGIDLAESALQAAREHLQQSGLEVEYLHSSVEQLAARRPGEFDVVTCMELLEHVPEPAALIADCARLVKPGGHLFFATINRTAKAWALAIVGAEYLLSMLPRGTHSYERFVRPSELERWTRAAELVTLNSTGMHYNPLTRSYRLGPGVEVNYLVHCQKQ